MPYLGSKAGMGRLVTFAFCALFRGLGEDRKNLSGLANVG